MGARTNDIYWRVATSRPGSETVVKANRRLDSMVRVPTSVDRGIDRYTL
jgi:hypothetical protein